MNSERIQSEIIVPVVRLLVNQIGMRSIYEKARSLFKENGYFPCCFIFCFGRWIYRKDSNKGQDIFSATSIY